MWKLNAGLNHRFDGALLRSATNYPEQQALDGLQRLSEWGDSLLEYGLHQSRG
jgi:hypothetical protein